METLEKHVPYLEQEGIEEVRRIAISFEELIFNTALNQVSLSSSSFYFCQHCWKEWDGRERCCENLLNFMCAFLTPSWLRMVCFEFQVDYFRKISLKMQTMEEDN